MFVDRFARAAAEAVNAHDPDAVVALWAEPADYHSALTGPQHGLDALWAREVALFSAFPDLRATITVVADHGSTATVHVHMNGTHQGAYAGISATGKAVALDMIASITFNADGKVVAERVSVDAEDLEAALRPRRPHRPPPQN